MLNFGLGAVPHLNNAGTFWLLISSFKVLSSSDPKALFFFELEIQ